MKNESSFKVIIPRGVVFAFYRFEIFCEEKKLGFGLLVLEFENFNRQRWMFECKLDPHIFRVLVIKLVNECAHLATKANSKI